MTMLQISSLLLDHVTYYVVCAHRTLADVDKDGRLQGDEFILAMHLVDMAKTGRPLPLTLPQDLVPPSLRCRRSLTHSLCLRLRSLLQPLTWSFSHFRGGVKTSELVNGTGPYITPCLIDTTEVEPAQKTKSSGRAHSAQFTFCYNVRCPRVLASQCSLSVSQCPSRTS